MVEAVSLGKPRLEVLTLVCRCMGDHGLGAREKRKSRRTARGEGPKWAFSKEKN